jgi:hypothetical protein
MPMGKGEDNGVNEPKDNEPTGGDSVAAGWTTPEGQGGEVVAAPLD